MSPKTFSFPCSPGDIVNVKVGTSTIVGEVAMVGIGFDNMRMVRVQWINASGEPYEYWFDASRVNPQRGY